MTHILQQPGPILESKGTGANFQKEQKKKMEKGKNTKIWEKMYKIENILKKGRWLHAIIARHKLLE